jgi:hypothetical protein
MNHSKQFIIGFLIFLIIPTLASNQSIEYELGISVGEEYIWEVIFDNDDNSIEGYRQKFIIKDISEKEEGYLFINFSYWSYTEGDFNEDPDHNRVERVSLDPAVMGAEAAVSIVSGFVFPFIPTPVNEWLKAFKEETYLKDEEWVKELSVSGSTLRFENDHNIRFEMTYTDKGVIGMLRIFRDDKLRFMEKMIGWEPSSLSISGSLPLLTLGVLGFLSVIIISLSHKNIIKS